MFSYACFADSNAALFVLDLYAAPLFSIPSYSSLSVLSYPLSSLVFALPLPFLFVLFLFLLIVLPVFFSGVWFLLFCFLAVVWGCHVLAFGFRVLGFVVWHASHSSVSL